MNLYLQREKEDGTILSLDFNNAFRSISLRWFHLVMVKLNIPNEFIRWFWKMYKNLGIIIVVNNCKSKILSVKRGFMEGHPSSMAAFVVSLIPFMLRIDKNLLGIKIKQKVHKSKLFADDMKIFLKDLNEINLIENIISQFEQFSGVRLHRDPSRGKCQALPFGKHEEFQEWDKWRWISVREKIKVDQR